MLKYWVWLAELRLTNQLRLALLRHFGTPEDVFFADEGEILLTEGITKEQAQQLKNHDLRIADRILADCQRLDQRILTIQDAEYPNRLKNIYDPPFLLYMKGRLPAVDEEAVIAVVGTRECSLYGKTCGEKMGYGITSGGGIVVSGLARGVDAAASRGALRAGGVTLGVVGGGLDIRYPWENRDLYEDVAAVGALLSEYPPGTSHDGWHFPIRNRILSGLAVATLVVEAPGVSGALITAHTALEQGRDVFAVPGPIDAPGCVGCNRLIRDSAAGLVMEPWDILREYTERFPGKLRAEELRELPEVPGYQTRQVQRAPAQKVEPGPTLPSLRLADSGLTDDQIALLRVLPAEEPVLADDLIEATGIPTRRVLSALTVLELDSLVRQHSGKRYTRTVTLEN